MLRAANFERRGNKLILQDNNGQKHEVSNRFGWSVHNCQHSGPKTGIVLYPANSNYKNTVVLVCNSHYQSRGDTRHEQLHNWYYDLYGESKQFRLVSGFALRQDGNLGFNSGTYNQGGPYTNNQREMGAVEEEIVRKVVNGKLDSYELS